jgi:methionine-rich copper-binding protein CopC
MKHLRLISIVTIALAMLGLGAALQTPAADAHVRVSSTTPASSSTAARSTRSVSVNFNGLIRSGTLRVTGPGGRVFSSGSGGRDPRDTKRLLVPMQRSLPAGRYTATWNIVAGDGHSQRGSFTFRLS